MNLEGAEIVDAPELLPVDQWIYGKLSAAASAVREALNAYRFNDAAQTVYEYFWSDFCDWYVEATKLSTRAGGGEKSRAITVLLDVLAESLKLLHPFLPFVTEEIWSKLPNVNGLLITQEFPDSDTTSSRFSRRSLLNSFSTLQDLITQIRTLRAECTLPPDRRLRVEVSGNAAPYIGENTELVKLLAGLANLEVTAGVAKKLGWIGITGSGDGDWDALIEIGGTEEMQKLRAKFEKSIAKEQGYINGLEKKLANEAFLKNAPPELVVHHAAQHQSQGCGRYRVASAAHQEAQDAEDKHH
jgi:valyl-tRNA synthetase